MHLWNVEGALHNPRGILQQNVLDGHIKVIFFWFLG